MPNIESFEEDSRQIARDIRMIMLNSERMTGVVKRLTLEEWRDFIDAYVDVSAVGEVISGEMIKRKMGEMDMARPFSSLFKEGKEYQVMLLPCDAQEAALDVADQKDGDHIIVFEIPSDADDKKGMGRKLKLLRDFMPAEIARDCTFSVEGYGTSPDGDDDAAQKERARVLSKYAQAVLRLKGHYSRQPAVSN